MTAVWFKKSGPKLIWTPGAGSVRRGPRGSERTAAMEKAGVLRNAADSHGV